MTPWGGTDPEVGNHKINLLIISAQMSMEEFYLYGRNNRISYKFWWYGEKTCNEHVWHLHTCILNTHTFLAVFAVCTCWVAELQCVTQCPTVSVQSAESHRLKELEQIKSHPASLAVTSRGRHSRPLSTSFHLTGFKSRTHDRLDGTDGSHSY